jgi:hypothetical protein
MRDKTAKFSGRSENAEDRSAETMSVGDSFQRVALETRKAWLPKAPSWRDVNEERLIGDVRPSAGWSEP